MYRNTKVATCCYCGTRAALVLDSGRHELVCRNCGAPLHELKALPVSPAQPKVRSDPKRSSFEDRSTEDRKRKAARPKKSTKKRKKIRAKKLFEEAFDFLEDIFD